MVEQVKSNRFPGAVKKKPRRPRKSKAESKDKKLKQKQKQKQIVNVNVSAGGGGSGGFIPQPVAPQPDYMMLANLLRPSPTVNVPLAAQVVAPPLPAKAAEPESLKEATAAVKRPTRKAPATPNPKGYEISLMPPVETRSSKGGEPGIIGMEFNPEQEFIIGPVTTSASKGKAKGKVGGMEMSSSSGGGVIR